MTATRPSPPFRIFQDSLHSVPAYQQPPPRSRPQLQPSAIPLKPLSIAPNIPSAPMPYPQHNSPQKMKTASQPVTYYPDMSYLSIPPPQQRQFHTDSPAKKPPPPPPPPPPASRPYRPEPVPQQPLFTTFNSNFDTFEQENYYHPAMTHDKAEFPEPSYVRGKALKRSYSDVIQTSDRPFKRPRVDDEAPGHLPEPDEMPSLEDDGNKPSYSYAQMIGMAILRAPYRRLTLAQIYDWISSTFAFYREDTKQGWHNSIRHNLSLNKAFQKMERPKGDAGKGSYWIIQPGMESHFLKDKSRKNNVANIQVHASIMRPEFQNTSQPVQEPLGPRSFTLSANLVPERPQTAPELPELSSDATLPASDPALAEDDGAEVDLANLPPPRSSPPDAINSSPPVPAVTRLRTGSSPTRHNRASILKHRRNAATMDDSGYFSSIESSILRPNSKSAIVLTSELDNERPRQKARSGRAEVAIEEVRRLRSSSNDLTPSHRRARSVNFALDAQSSSPLNATPPSKDPVTPGVFKKPLMRPPPSVSPNTQLHIHRRAMQEFTDSPIKNFGLSPFPTLEPSLLEAWSPLKWPSTNTNAGGDEFEIFSDPVVGMTPCGAISRSPNRSISRPSLIRASTTANVLGDVLGNASGRLNAKTPTKAPTFHALLKPSPCGTLKGSPVKRAFDSSGCPIENHDDIFDWEQFENENDNDDAESDENTTLDLTKGFGKIGAPATHDKVQGQLKRPASGRSLTARF